MEEILSSMRMKSNKETIFKIAEKKSDKKNSCFDRIQTLTSRSWPLKAYDGSGWNLFALLKIIEGKYEGYLGASTIPVRRR